MTAPPAPSLPFPIYQVSQKIPRYLLYSPNVITWLRQNHNILGVLIGSLPQIPQQNVFLGLPLELQPEEARLLVESGLAYIVNDLRWHVQSLAAMTAEQKEGIRADLRREGVRIAEEFESNKKSRTKRALKRIQEQRSDTPAPRSDASLAPGEKKEEEEDNAEVSLFHETTTVSPSPHPSQPTESSPTRRPWSLTPTSSHPLLLSPPPPKANTHPPPPLPSVSPPSYALFTHLHRLGYYLTPGIRFGCHFSVYPGDPLRFHSHFLAMSAGWDEEIGLLELVGGGRLGTGVKKGWLVGGVEEKVEREEGQVGGEGGVEEGGEGEGEGRLDGSRVRTFCIEWGGM